ncbi:MAG TPA: DNA cytosine methyltransferase [Verrucomicrobiae bacterium]|nr:DNA cytosine methyltransferase [Verrucomicrobiae bacterium]
MSKHKKSIKFIDLFAGIGGIRLGFERAGFECVYTNEYDKSAAATYAANFEGKIDTRDIRDVNEQEIPKFDVLCAGFPCQPFSLAGISARYGLKRAHGFKDEKQGNLFFEIIRIVEYHKPSVVFLENVANLEKHEKGQTLATIKKSLEDMGYLFEYKVIDASTLLPQRRKRIYMVANLENKFQFKDIEPKVSSVKEIFEKNPDSRFTISDRLWESHKARTIRNQEKGHGFRHYMVDPNGIANTLTSRYGKDGRENLVVQKGKNPRMLTPRECARLMGFPDSFELPLAKTPAYRQFGNSVCVPVIESLANQVYEQLSQEEIAKAPAKEESGLTSLVTQAVPIAG